MSQMRCRYHPLLLLALLQQAAGKVIEGVMTLSSQDTEQYMAKFSFSPYVTSHIDGVFHTDKAVYFDGHPHDMALCLYDEVQWRKFREALTKGSLCIERRQLASWSTKIHPAMKDKPRHEFSFESTLSAGKSRAHYWFAVLMDCYLEEYDAHPPALHYSVTFTNGHSHLPADESGMTTINLVLFIGMTGYGVFYFGRAIRRMQQLGQTHLCARAALTPKPAARPRGTRHAPPTHRAHSRSRAAHAALAANHAPVAPSCTHGHLCLTRARRVCTRTADRIVLLFGLAYALQTFSVLCELMHLRRYASDGKGLRWRHTWLALDFLSGLTQSCSELLISVLLIGLGFGWTLGLESQAPIEGFIGKLLSGLHAPGKLLRGLRSPSTILLGLIGASQLVSAA